MSHPWTKDISFLLTVIQTQAETHADAQSLCLELVKLSSLHISLAKASQWLNSLSVVGEIYFANSSNTTVSHGKECCSIIVIQEKE